LHYLVRFLKQQPLLSG